MAKLTTSAAELVNTARSRIEEIETVSAVSMVDNPDVVIVDLRDIRERERSGFIPGSFHCPRGMAEFWVDPQSPYFKEIFGQDKKFVFHCASGWRSALTVATLFRVRARDGAPERGAFRTPLYPLTPLVFLGVTLAAWLNGLIDAPIPTGAALGTLALGAALYAVGRTRGTFG